MLKKLIASFFAFLILTVGSMTYFAQAAHAQWYQQNFFEYISIVESGGPSELYGERYAAAQVRWIVYGLIYLILPEEITCIIADLDDPTAWPACGLSTLLGSLPDGSNLASEVSPQPSNQSVLATFAQKSVTVNYVKSIGSKWHVVPEVQAQQGFGFETAGQLVFDLWKAVRDVAYSFLIIIIIVMAFMIMFRVKLSPQTVITVQSALPKVVMTLILITFSYAIAGLMIDFMYVVIGLLAAILRSSNLVDSGAIQWDQLFFELTNGNGAVWLGVKYWILSAFSLFYALSSNAIGFIGLIGATQVLFIITFVILTVVIFILAFRVWWMLLKNFILIIFSIAFAPIQILMGAFGGGGFSGWAKNFASLLAVYPVVGFMYVLAFVFLRGAYSGFDANLINLLLGNADPWPFDVADVFQGANNWVPPLTWGSGDLDLVWMGASVAVLSLIPKASDMIKSFISGRPFAYGSAIGEGLAFASGAGAALWGSTTAGVERSTLGKYGARAALRVSEGQGSAADRLIANLAMRRGHVDVPSAQKVRQRNVIQQPKDSPTQSGRDL